MNSAKSTLPPVTTIFISSPGDVSEEREKSRLVIEELRQYFDNSVQLRLLLWEDLPLQPDTSFQDGIDLVLSEKYRVDIAVFILWARLGSPVGGDLRRPDGSPYRSGTERELDLMLAARKQTGGRRPQILVYRRTDDAGFKTLLAKHGDDADKTLELAQQRKQLNSFIQGYFEDQDGSNRRANHPYNKPSAFARHLKTHLRELLCEMLDQSDGGARLRELKSQKRKARFTQVAVLVMSVIVAVLTTAWYNGRDFGSLVILTEPAGAAITAAGHDWGVTPYRKYVPEGFWELQIQKTGFLTQTVQVQIVKSQRNSFSFVLAPVHMPTNEIPTLPNAAVSTNGIARLSSAGATLVSFSGKVEVLRSGSSFLVPGTTNMVLFPRDHVRTGEDSRAVVQMNDKTQIRLGELSDLQLTPRETDDTPFLSLRRGLMYFFRRDRTNEFQISTPMATGAPRG